MRGTKVMDVDAHFAFTDSMLEQEHEANDIREEERRADFEFEYGDGEDAEFTLDELLDAVSKQLSGMTRLLITTEACKRIRLSRKSSMASTLSFKKLLDFMQAVDCGAGEIACMADDGDVPLMLSDLKAADVHLTKNHLARLKQAVIDRWMEERGGV